MLLCPIIVREMIMKRIFALILVCLMVFFLASCKQKDDTQAILTSEEQIEQKLDASYYPVPRADIVADSNNSMELSFSYTLKEYTKMLNQSYRHFLGESNDENVYFYSKNWQLMSSQLTDDNGVKYSSYYYEFSDVVLTAAVENETGLVMNIGCGCTYQDFENDVDGYQFTYMIMSAMVCAVGCGYETDDMNFIYYIFLDAINSDKAFYYEGVAYTVKYQQGEDDQKGSVLCMASPISEQKLSSWNLSDYKEYEDSYRFDIN